MRGYPAARRPLKSAASRPRRLLNRRPRDRSSARKSARLKRGASQVRFLPVTSTRLRSSIAERPVLTRGGAGSTPAGATLGRNNSGKDCHRRGIPSRKRVGLRALGVRLPLLPLAEAWPSWKGSALLPRRRRQSRSQVRVRCLPPHRSGVVELERRAVVTRESAGSSPAAGALCCAQGGESASADTPPREDPGPPWSKWR